MNARDSEHLSTLLSQSQGLSQQCQFSIDGTVGQTSGLACRDIGSETRLIDGHQSLVIRAGANRLEFNLHISQLPIARHLVVLNQGVGDLAKPDTLQPR